MADRTIGLTPSVSGVGGMVSFKAKLSAGLAERGIRVTDDIASPEIHSLLVIGGTRDLSGLRAARRRGARIVQRLDGMNWLQRRMKTGLHHFLRAEAANWLLQYIRRDLADAIVYQSRFSREWWERVYKPTNKANTVIYNGVDLGQYSPEGSHERPTGHFRLLLVEGSLQGGYETGLSTAVRLLDILRAEHSLPVRLAIAGKVSPELKSNYSNEAIDWLGLVERERIPQIDRSAHLLFSADLNAACPNSVIEALACGLPVAAFDTGALPELVDENAGCIVPYGGDPWRLDPPDMTGLAQACAEIFNNGESLRLGARRRAEAMFGLDEMVSAYLRILHRS